MLKGGSLVPTVCQAGSLFKMDIAGRLSRQRHFSPSLSQNRTWSLIKVWLQIQTKKG